MKMWKLLTKLLAENMSIKPVVNRKVTKATNLKEWLLVFIKDHQKGTFNPSYVFNIGLQA